MATTQAVAFPVPFLRWAGSKRWLIPTLETLLPAQFNSYFEPFLGSGAVFFRYAAGHPAYLSDIIEPLIDAYIGVRDSPEQVSTIAQQWSTDTATYYRVRASSCEIGTPYAAARFIYLNRLCFNGLYRENGKGEFNVPYGRPRATNVIVEPNNLKACARTLQSNVHISAKDFESALLQCRGGDFAYLDPPYVAGHRSNGFVDYNATIFKWKDQERLLRVFRQLDGRGAYVIQTNADHPTLREMYSDYACLRVSRHSSMSGSPQSRGQSKELLILSSRLADERLR